MRDVEARKNFRSNKCNDIQIHSLTPGIQNFHSFIPRLIFNFQLFHSDFFRDSHKSSLGKRREEKTQHEIQIKSFQNFSPTQNTAAGIQERCRCVFKMINGNEKLFSALAYVLSTHMCSFSFYIDEQAETWAVVSVHVLITTLDFRCSLPHQFKEIKSAELAISLIGGKLGRVKGNLGWCWG